MKSGVVVWLTGLPRSGKSTLAGAVQARLAQRGVASVVLDGDEVRAALVPRPGYDPAARDAFYATLGGLAALIARQGLIALVPATANLRAYRDHARMLAPRFVEVHLDVEAEACAERDPAGLYLSAARPQLPGVGAPYEPPVAPDVVAHGGRDERALAAILASVCDG